jgi:hypothetical protein
LRAGEGSRLRVEAGDELLRAVLEVVAAVLEAVEGASEPGF